VLAVLACAACSSSPAEPPDPTPAGAPPVVAFTATVTPGAGALAITYKLINQSPGDLVAVDRLPAGSGAVYVTGKENGRVEVSRRVFPRRLTDKVSWATTPSAAGTVVAPGESVGASITVALPLARVSPYGNDLGDGEIKLPDPVEEVVFCLGVVPRAAVPAAPGADGSVVVVHDSRLAGVQHLFCSGPAHL